MKTAILLFAFFLAATFVSNAQNRNRAPGPDRYDETVYVYKTYEDYKAGKAQDMGHFEYYSWGNMGRGTKIKVKSASGKVDNLKMDAFWGFKIDRFTFRCVNNEMPVAFLGQKQKQFYLNGAFYLSMIYHNATTGININDSEPLFYSDDDNSKIIELDKLRKSEKDNPMFTPLFECLKAAKKNRKDKDEVTGQVACVADFVK